MRRVARVALFALLGLALARVVAFLATAAIDFRNPFEVFFLEATFVHLGRRFQEGLELYPAWSQAPFAPNLFGPVYPILVGSLGRAFDADVDALFRIARGVSIGSTVAGAFLAGGFAGRRWGRGAGLLAGLLMLGSLPTLRFATMARPDALSETLALAGFLLAIGHGRLAAAVALLVAASLTKQTAGLYALAAGIGLMVDGRRARALAVFGGTVGGLALIVLAPTLTVAPHFAGSLLGQALLPYKPAWTAFLARRLLLDAPELLLGCAAGAVLWSRGASREPALAALAVCAPVLTLLAALKEGSDYNYFLPVRTAAALGMGALWEQLRKTSTRGIPVRLGPAALSCLAAASLIPGLLRQYALWEENRMKAISWTLSEGKELQSTFRELVALASDDSLPILTDSSLLAVHQGRRAAIADPWMFRQLVRLRRIQPVGLSRMLRDGRYAGVVSTNDLLSPAYGASAFDLPPELTDPIRRAYKPSGHRRAGFQLFVPQAASRGE